MPREGLALAQEQIAAAAFDPEGWTEALRCTAFLGQSPMGQLVGASPEHGVVFNWGSGVPLEVYGAFVEAGGGDPGRNPRAAATFTMPLFNTRTEQDFITPDQIRRSPFYNDFARPFDLDYVCMSRLESVGDLFPTLALIRPRNAGVYEAKQRLVLERLAPRFSKALRMHSQLEGKGAQVVAGALDGLGSTAVILDHSARIRAMTRTGEADLAARRPIESYRGRARAICGKSDGRLQAAVQRACSRRLSVGPDIEDVVLFDRESTPHVVQVAPLPWSAWSSGQGAAAILIMRAPRLTRDAEAVLRQARGLTKTEAAVALQMAQGASPAEIAEDRAVSIETVRNQLKRIMSKLGVNTQLALAREISRLVQLG